MNFPAIKAEHRNAGRGWLAAIGLTLFCFFYAQGQVPFQDSLRDFGFDTYQKVSPREQVSAPVRIVTIDERSLERYGQWPWPRSLTAQLVERINALSPAAIGLNILMPEPDRSAPCRVVSTITGVEEPIRQSVCNLPDPDELLAQQLFTTRSVLGVAGLNDTGGRSDFSSVTVLSQDPEYAQFLRSFPSGIGNLPDFEFAASGLALLDTDTSSDIVRELPLLAQVGSGVMPALSLELLRVALGIPAYEVTTNSQGVQSVALSDVVVPTARDGQFWIHYARQNPARYISAADILDGEVSAEAVQSRLVIVGVSAAGLAQFPTTVLGESVPGAEIHAQVVENIFDEALLQRPDWGLWLESGLILALGLLVIWIFPLLGAAYQVPMLLLVASGLIYSGFYLFAAQKLLIDITTPTFAFSLMYILMLTDSFIREEAQVKALAKDLQKRREEAARTQGEMEAARRFQMGIVPDSYEVFHAEPRIDISASMDPAREVGGDLYDFFYLDEHRIFFGLGDVCGKGVQASLFMVIAKTLMKSIVSRADADQRSLANVVTRLNTEIGRDNPEMLFVTLFAGVLDLRTGILEYCNAGHEPPALVESGQTPYFLDQKSGPPVGALDEFEYRSYTTQLNPQQYLCVYTDGLTEAANAHQELYTQERLVDSLCQEGDQSATEKLQRVVQQINLFVGEREPADDLTLVILRWSHETANGETNL